VARRAKNEGATRFCMGAAWHQVWDGENFARLLEIVRAVAALYMEVCCHTRHAQRIAGQAAEGRAAHRV